MQVVMYTHCTTVYIAGKFGEKNLANGWMDGFIQPKGISEIWMVLVL